LQNGYDLGRKDGKDGRAYWKYGVYHARGEERNKNLFEDIGCPADKKAEYVLLSGCMPPLDTPSIFSALKNFLDHYGVSYTFLSKEYCCGWLPLVQPAVMAKKDEDSIKQLKGVAEEFLKENINHAKKLRAKAIVTICAPTRYRTKRWNEIIHYQIPGALL
jgi:Fe-S oxidoreductase